MRRVDLTPERYVVLAIAIATIVLAAVAAFVQDDLEHVLGYSIVGDAGVIVLALAVVGPDALAPGRTWILAFIVARGAFAVWAAGIRAGFFTGRVADLRGWARRSPILAVAFVLVAVASVGFPGLASFEARVVARRPGRRVAARRPARDRRARASHLLRAAARHRAVASPTGSANRSSRGGPTPCAPT